MCRRILVIRLSWLTCHGVRKYFVLCKESGSLTLGVSVSQITLPPVSCLPAPQKRVINVKWPCTLRSWSCCQTQESMVKFSSLFPSIPRFLQDAPKKPPRRPPDVQEAHKTAFRPSRWRRKHPHNHPKAFFATLKNLLTSIMCLYVFRTSSLFLSCAVPY